MRTKIILALSVIGLCALSATAQTQTNQPPPTPQAFYQSVLDYFGSNDPTMQFTRFKLWTEGDYQNNVNFADKIAVSFDLYTSDATYTNAITFGVEAGMRNAGIAGTIVDGGGGVNLSYNVDSIRVEGYADGAYSQISQEPFAELGIRILKKATANTFLGLSLGFQVPTTPRGGPAYPIFGVLAGATF